MLNKDGGSSMDLLESESFKMLELVSQELPLPIFAAVNSDDEYIGITYYRMTIPTVKANYKSSHHSFQKHLQ